MKGADMSRSRSTWMVATLAILCAIGPVRADEGMWTFNQFPSASVRQKYGFEPDAAWLDHLRLSSVRIAGGCSASVVSANGLVMTNHHCVRDCVDTISGQRKKDYNRDGFHARTTAEETRCPSMEINQLVEITAVTTGVQDATRDVPPAGFAEAQKAAIAIIEKQCATSDDFRCEVVSLFRGGRYDLYKYRRFQDIRLVFAPEESVAFFGGDPDNFNFPRYDLDVSFIRIYGRDGLPQPMGHHLAWSQGTLRDGDAVFVSGNPGGTSRGMTVAQLVDERDYRLPPQMNFASQVRGLLTEYQHRGAEQKRHSVGLLWGFENWLKAAKGQHGALADSAFLSQLVRREQALREKVASRPELQTTYGKVWDEIATIVQREQVLRKERDALEDGPMSSLFSVARRLLRYGDEIGKPNGERLKEYADARLPQLKQRLLAPRPIYDELEIATLTWSLTKLREDLGPDHPVVKQVLGLRSPADVADSTVKGSRLKDIRADKTGNPIGGYRKALWDGGKAAIDASQDPMLRLARAYDPAARAVRRRFETEVEGPMKQQQESLARARFAVEGEGSYPDATFTLRLTYGAVRGYVEDGVTIQPFTTLEGAFGRHTGAAPYALPASWLKARSALKLDTPMNFVADTDIIGGNSGSPVVNPRGEVVGLVFDGNIQSLGADYGFDAAVNRTVAVHSAAIVEALGKVYGARRLVRELTGGR
jgi:hypothetical protein